MPQALGIRDGISLLLRIEEIRPRVYWDYPLSQTRVNYPSRNIAFRVTSSLNTKVLALIIIDSNRRITLVLCYIKQMLVWYTLPGTIAMRDMFKKFIAIDWSGARGPRPKNLKTAVCEPGELAPSLVGATKGKHWRRDELFDWIVGEAEEHCILVGLDFAFAYPYCDHNAYFPENVSGPKSALELWQTVESICQTEQNFYGGPLYQDRRSPFYEYFCYQTHTGLYYDNKRLRKTEQACKLLRTQPTCSFKCVGPDQVGSGSAAGMRALHFIDKDYGNLLAIWPFNGLAKGKSVLVEIFPRLFFTMAKEDPRQVNNISVVNAVLRHFGSKPLPQGTRTESEDEADAIVSAAALRSLSSNGKVWHPQSLDKEVRIHEGWIFGIR